MVKKLSGHLMSTGRRPARCTSDTSGSNSTPNCSCRQAPLSIGGHVGHTGHTEVTRGPRDPTPSVGSDSFSHCNPLVLLAKMRLSPARCGALGSGRRSTLSLWGVLMGIECGKTPSVMRALRSEQDSAAQQVLAMPNSCQTSQSVLNPCQTWQLAHGKGEGMFIGKPCPATPPLFRCQVNQ